jgi:hypothetical protein
MTLSKYPWTSYLTGTAIQRTVQTARALHVHRRCAYAAKCELKRTQFKDICARMPTAKNVLTKPGLIRQGGVFVAVGRQDDESGVDLGRP